MGKKPVLGLVGLFVGLTLSGCKDCSCGWLGGGSRKDPDPPIATAQKKPAAREASVWNQRERTLQDRTVAGKGGDPSRLKSSHEEPVTPRDLTGQVGGANEAAEMAAEEQTPPVSPGVIRTRLTEPRPPAVDTRMPDEMPAGGAEIPPAPLSMGKLPMAPKVATPVKTPTVDPTTALSEPTLPKRFDRTDRKPVTLPKTEEGMINIPAAPEMPPPVEPPATFEATPKAAPAPLNEPASEVPPPLPPPDVKSAPNGLPPAPDTVVEPPSVDAPVVVPPAPPPSLPPGM